jgi:hypothetical protein
VADSILTNADYTRLNTALGRIQAQKEVLHKAQAVGLDMTEPLALLEAQQHTIEQIKKQFIPDRP